MMPNSYCRLLLLKVVCMSFGQGIALLSFLVSMGTIVVTYWVGSHAGTIEVCNPFLEGCTDITHTGMKGDGGFIFRGGMIAATVLFIIWWHLMRVWMQHWMKSLWLWGMQALGTVSALGLLVGTVVLLPNKEDVYWSLHVYGANLFFQAIALAITFNYVLLLKAWRDGFSVPSFWLKTIVFVGLWSTAFISAGFSISENMSQMNRTLEWWSTALVGVYFLSAWMDWRGLSLGYDPAR